MVQFRPEGDPSAEQTATIRSIVKRFERTAAVKGEFSGALRIEVSPESEAELRRSLGELKDWDVGSEGTAQMPPKPVLKE